MIVNNNDMHVNRLVTWGIHTCSGEYDYKNNDKILTH